jgi:hypothetical protein
MQERICLFLNTLARKANHLRALLAEHDLNDLDDQAIALCKLGVVTDRTCKQFDKILTAVETAIRSRTPKPEPEPGQE